MSEKNIADNRKAFHDYFILDRYEAGISLSGTEVKSIRSGKINLKDSYVQVKDNEMFIVGVHISPYEAGNRFNRDPMRIRKLLMHKQEIIKLYSKVKQDGLTIVPTRCYFRNGKVKLEIALAKGKAKYDKRDSIAQKDAQREIAGTIKRSNQTTE
ncbi:MAG: SsrA-binding protein SmpB [Clostridiaceae bacterium]|jgi:SsrA-binding protein|nr:SsrA-binding protein SmpB [Oscillospiraceae bacterium]NLO62674.1 SsrA-binding protein SmpB [Clostridiaceae bacterium]